MKIDKTNMIITIESEPGSRGEEIARELSKMTGIPCYGKEILDAAAQISGIPARLMHRYDGRAVHAAYDLMAEDEASIKLPPARDFITAQVFACRKLAQNGACILVDRHASAALAGNENQISIFIHSDFEARAKVLAEQRGINMESAKKTLKKLDTSYRSYYRGNNKNWGNASNYSLSLNASACKTSDLAGIIESFLVGVVGEAFVPGVQKIAM